MSEAELHFIKARLRGGVLSKARRGELITPLPVGLAYDSAGHVILDPDTAVRGAVAHLFATPEATGSATAVVKSVQHRQADLPLAAPQRTPQGRGRLAAAGPPHPCCGCCTIPAAPARSPTAGTATTNCPAESGRPRSWRAKQWISFIPGAHPGYITLDQYDANIAKLAASAAAHGRDRAAGPPREGSALLQGVIICGKCGTRMTVRYHRRRGTDWPTYLCQRDGIENARPICAAIPGAGLDRATGQLLVTTLTPLAVEAALTVIAELEHRVAAVLPNPHRSTQTVQRPVRHHDPTPLQQHPDLDHRQPLPDLPFDLGVTGIQPLPPLPGPARAHRADHLRDLPHQLIGQLHHAAAARQPGIHRSLHIPGGRSLRSTPARAATCRSPAPASHARSTSRISVTPTSRNAIPNP